MKKLFLYAGLLALLVAAGCKSDGDEPIPEPKPKPTPGTTVDTTRHITPVVPVELKKAEKVARDNTFTFDLLRAVRKHTDKTNVFISPLSVSMALNMTLNGAVGATADEMRTALRESGYSTADINAYSRELREALLRADPKTTIGIANSIWYHQGATVKAPFIEANRTYYDAEVQAINFSAPSATATINGWCARKTNNKIKEIVKRVDPTTFMYLINAVYFKGAWTTRFEKKNTRSGDFRRADGSTQQVQMMRLRDTFHCASSDVCDYLEMDYGNHAFSMVIMLPKDGKTTRDVIAMMDGKKWADAMQSLTLKEIHVLLPRFKAECEYPMHEHILPDMGMKLPFNSELADLSGIADIGAFGRLFISSVIHKTFVQVDEEGTEAAAVTSIDIVGSNESSFFIVDRPFLFAIREKSTGVILFIGEIGEIQ
ncbi:serpin family protein [Tannerella serpentiformis]|uniref:serpin family protein n=1 Tax=Tannerella serpentiformis TaxID=712710 RepID=UPI000840B9A1|nr:serpin family protein [Tannerella serpentiformis]AOH40314.1 serpin family protein [Tannerella serpentiformis]AVV54219.1 serpin family protein [Tannerella serpentiformis]